MPVLPQPEDVAVVHRATSEFEAISIRDILEAAGVPVMVRSRVVPGYGVPTLHGGQAGIVADILVPPERAEEARDLIAGYLASLEPAPEAPPQEIESPEVGSEEPAP